MKRFFILFTFLSVFNLGGIHPLEAASNLPQNVLIRDAEIEQALKDFMGPLFQVAGLDVTQLKVLILNSTEVNAAAGLEYTMLVNTGLITRSENLGQLIGVLAHETGHIAGRHNERIINSGNQAIVPLIGALLIGGAITALAGTPEPLVAALMGGSEISQNTMLAYQRGHEGAADQAAFKYMEKLGWSSKGFMEFMEILHKQELLSTERQYAYKRTHPFMIDRMRLVEKHCKDSKNTDSPFPDDFEKKYERIRIKILGYTEQPNRFLQRFPETDQCLYARYGRAIAYHQSNRKDKALQEIDSLLKEFPNDPFFLEFKGQIMFENGQIEQAIDYYKQAVKLLPKNSLLKIQLAHILLESNTGDKSQEVIKLLDNAHNGEDQTASLWRLYATAYGRLKQEGMVSLMLAEEAVQLGDIEQAHHLAEKALKQLPANKNTSAQRARDILTLEIPPQLQ